MSHAVSLGRVDIYHYLKAAGTELSNNIVKNLQTVHAYQIIIGGIVKVSGRILTIFPL